MYILTSLSSIAIFTPQSYLDFIALPPYGFDLRSHDFLNLQPNAMLYVRFLRLFLLIDKRKVYENEERNEILLFRIKQCYIPDKAQFVKNFRFVKAALPEAW